MGAGWIGAPPEGPRQRRHTLQVCPTPKCGPVPSLSHWDMGKALTEVINSVPGTPHGARLAHACQSAECCWSLAILEKANPVIGLAPDRHSMSCASGAFDAVMDHALTSQNLC